MDVQPGSSKFCFFIKMMKKKKKTGCLLMAYFLLVFQSIVLAQEFYPWIIKESVLKILEENEMASWNFVALSLSIGLALVLTIATISFMVELLVGSDEIIQLIFVAQAFHLWITKESFLKMLEENKMDSWNLFLIIQSIALVLVLTIATIPFMITLLVDLHKSNTRLTKVFLMFSSIMLTVTVLFCIASENAFDTNPITAIRGMLFLVYAYFPYMMSNYYVNVTENSQQYEDA